MLTASGETPQRYLGPTVDRILTNFVYRHHFYRRHKTGYRPNQFDNSNNGGRLRNPQQK